MGENTSLHAHIVWISLNYFKKSIFLFVFSYFIIFRGNDIQLLTCLDCKSHINNLYMKLKGTFQAFQWYHSLIKYLFLSDTIMLQDHKLKKKSNCAFWYIWSFFRLEMSLSTLVLLKKFSIILKK